MGSRELNKFLRDARHKPFEWVEWDCFTFTNEAWRAMNGHGWADEWIGRYSKDKLKRKELRKEFGFRTLPDAIDSKLDRCEALPPPKGALLITPKAQRWVTGYAMGICIGTYGVFLGREGLIYLPIEHAEKAWL